MSCHGETTGNDLVNFLAARGFFLTGQYSPGILTLAPSDDELDFRRWVTIDQALPRLTEGYIRQSLERAALSWDDFCAHRSRDRRN